MNFGEKLKKARTDANVTQSELADRLNTTANTISNWENNVSKPDLDKLSYICGILHVTASYFLQATLPDDEVSIPELIMVKKYRELDGHGKEMVDFTLSKEWERSKSLISEKDIVDNIPEKEVYKPNIPFINAAHARTDIEIPEGIDTSDDDIMDDEDF